MQTLGSYITQVQTLINDSSGSLFSTAQYTNFINQARTQVSFDSKCNRVFYPNLNTINQQETYCYNGTIGGITLTAGGTGYTSAPTVVLTGGGGTGAAAVALITNGVITQVNMTNWGSGYTSRPAVSFTGGAGTGATAAATWLYNVFDVINVSIIWGSDRQTLGWLEFTRFQAFLRAYTQNYSIPGVFTLYQSASLIYLSNIPNQVYGMELDVSAASTDLVNLTDIDMQIYSPYDVGVAYYASFLALLSIQDDRYVMYYDGKGGGLYETQTSKYPSQTYTRRIFNPYYSGNARLRRM